MTEKWGGRRKNFSKNNWSPSKHSNWAPLKWGSPEHYCYTKLFSRLLEPSQEQQQKEPQQPITKQVPSLGKELTL